ncbi:Uncharacterised protein [Vibrio cholerae]|nr:Uncharacterised protein [Vibrio cholerae]
MIELSFKLDNRRLNRYLRIGSRREIVGDELNKQSLRALIFVHHKARHIVSAIK